MNTRFTRKQIEIMELIQRGGSRGELLDIDELWSRLSYDCSKQALQCSLRKLRDRGMVQDSYEYRREARRRILSVSPAALSYFDVGSGSFDVIVEGNHH